MLLALALRDTREMGILLEQIHQSDKEFATDPATLPLLFDYLAETEDFEGLRMLYETSQAKGPVSLPQATVERIAWKTIEAASKAYHPRVRAEALVAAAQSQDVRGMYILKKLMTDNHQGIQQAALQLAVHYPDTPIQRQAEQLALSGLPETKLGAARLLAFQKAPSAEKTLSSLLIDDTLSEEDQLQIASCLSTLRDEVDINWLQKAVDSEKPAIRALAAASVLAAPTHEGLACLLPLLNDSSANVRKWVFQTLGAWQPLIPDASQQLIASWTADLRAPSIDLASVAAWALLLSSQPEAKQAASSWFRHAILGTTEEKALLATARLLHAGESGVAVAQALIDETRDPLVQLNLARYLLSHRRNGPTASTILQAALASSPLLGEQSDGLFSWIGPSQIPHHPAIPRLPESQDLFLRLQLLALRCYAGQPVSHIEVEKMLNDRGWGISAAAATLLFQEFGHSLDDVLSPLLSHETEVVRVQAALLLTLISQSQQAASHLAKQYEKASREGKEAIILGFGSLPLSRTKRYLTPLLFDPSPVLRTRAAGALLSSMYR